MLEQPIVKPPADCLKGTLLHFIDNSETRGCASNYVCIFFTQGTNACSKNNGNCSHMCIPSPNFGRFCACPEGMTPTGDDSTRCHVKPCKDGKFRCGNGYCIDQSSVVRVPSAAKRIAEGRGKGNPHEGNKNEEKQNERFNMNKKRMSKV